MHLISHRHEADNVCGAPLSIKLLPEVVCKVHINSKIAVHPGADLLIPKFAFLVGNQDVAASLFKQCQDVSRRVATCMNGLIQTVTEALRQAVEEGLKTSCAPVESDTQFLESFDIKKCEAGLKKIAGAISKADLIRRQCEVDIDTKEAMKTRDTGRAAINRCALVQLVARPHVNNVTAGKALRKQLKAIWASVKEHSLVEYISEPLRKHVENVLDTVHDEEECKTPMASEKSGEGEGAASTSADSASSMPAAAKRPRISRKSAAAR